MDSLLKYLENAGDGLCRLGCDAEERLTLDDKSAETIYLVENPSSMQIDVTTCDRAAQIVVLRSESSDIPSSLDISLGVGAKLNLVEVMYNSSKSSVSVCQSANSLFNSTLLQLSSADALYVVDMLGEGAETKMDMLQLLTDKELSRINLRISHLVPNCTSRSASKCAAAGESTGEFHGLVYVAQGAQRTLSEQSSRNVALSRDAKIIAEPQLEIYADDVKCTHGATVGQMNSDAILYMRQRGLNEEVARRLQLDGFAAEVTSACAIESLREVLGELVHDRLHVV